MIASGSRRSKGFIFFNTQGRPCPGGDNRGRRWDNKEERDLRPRSPNARVSAPSRMARGRGLCSGAGHTCGRAPQTLARETRARYTHVWSHFLVVPLRNPPIAIVRPRIPHSRSYLSRTLPPLALSLAAACAVTCGEGRCPQPSHPHFRVSLARHLNVAPHQLGLSSNMICYLSMSNL